MENVELRDIPGFEGYAATQDGRIWSYKSNIFLKDRASKDGYRRVNLMLDGKQKTRFVHQLVALSWIDNPDNLPCLNHRDEKKDNNCVENLEWCDQTYNNNYGTRTERARKARHKAVRCVETGIVYPSYRDAAQTINLTAGAIGACVRGENKTAGGLHWELVKEN